MGEKTYFEMFSGLQKFDMALYFFYVVVFVMRRFTFCGLALPDCHGSWKL